MSLDQIIRLYCCTMDTLRGQISPENALRTADIIWTWAKGVIERDAPRGQPQSTSESSPRAQADKKTARLTVQKVTLAGEGETKTGRPYKRYTVQDTQSGLWSTFHQNVEVGATYDIEYTENEFGKTIQKLKAVDRIYMSFPDGDGGHMLDEADDSIPF